jgi:predicted RNA-binding Zn ribbon-like protein
VPNAPTDPMAFPLLGEPFVVEFANTWYRSGGEVTDFLASSDLTKSWFTHAVEARNYLLPTRLTNRLSGNLRELRDSLHSICTHIADALPGVPEGVAPLNRFVRLATGRHELHWERANSVNSTIVFRGSASDVLMATLASDSIAFLGGPDRLRIRRCATPICELFFVQRHHLRNFCSEPCSQRTRQARYYDAKLKGS